MPSFVNSIECFSQGNQARKHIKGIQIRKEVVKLSLVTDKMITYKEIPKKSTKNNIISN